MNKQISDELLDQQIKQLTKEMEPERDLWRGVEKAIATLPQQQEKKSTVLPMAWAASIVVAILVSWLSFLPEQVTGQDSELSIAQVMQSDFEKQKQLVLASFGQPKLSELPTDLQKQLDELSSARAAISKALSDDPQNSELLNLLRWAQKQEIDLLKQLYTPQWQTI
ncbi:hypothetical protein [Thalassotalea sp. G2M2-11]|uniref:hypothetical protein n=1 Tax=Thalassotalea sp. G2M2-11 TaxID=2787627 RepID=UPI0019D00822|nr:hypothetical protein [Thalassotalea sp. G2M2-11]